MVFIPIFIGLLLGGCRIEAGTAMDAPDKDAVESTERTQVTHHSTSVNNMKLQIKAGQEVLHATLYDNAAARDFVAILPLTLTLEDYNRTEKIAPLPGRPSTDGLPQGYEPRKNDIAFYVPWGNLCIFYRDFRYSPGLVSLGKIEGDGISTLAGADRITISIDVQK